MEIFAILEAAFPSPDTDWREILPGQADPCAPRLCQNLHESVQWVCGAKMLIFGLWVNLILAVCRFAAILPVITFWQKLCVSLVCLRRIIIYLNNKVVAENWNFNPPSCKCLRNALEVTYNHLQCISLLRIRNFSRFCWKLNVDAFWQFKLYLDVDVNSLPRLYFYSSYYTSHICIFEEIFVSSYNFGQLKPRMQWRSHGMATLAASCGHSTFPEHIISAVSVSLS